MATQRISKPATAASAKKLAAKPADIKKTAVKAKPAAKAKPATPKTKPSAKAKPVAARKPAAPQPTERHEPAAADAPKRVKPKLVRDSFTIPKAEYTVLGALKQRAIQLGQQSKKSELLRAGVKALAAMADAEFLVALSAVPAIKTGRPKSKGTDAAVTPAPAKKVKLVA